MTFDCAFDLCAAPISLNILLNGFLLFFEPDTVVLSCFINVYVHTKRAAVKSQHGYSICGLQTYIRTEAAMHGTLLYRKPHMLGVGSPLIGPIH